MGYAHTQRAPLHLLLWATAVLMFVLAYFGQQEAQWVALLLAGVGVLVVFLAFCFGSLTVRDEGDALGIRYGPLRVFGRRAPYASMASVKAARSAIIDGWGIHWVPGRGWTWNLWGRDCVEIETTHGLLRVGTDDPQGLLGFLEKRIGAREA